jgi:adenylate cyclase
VPIERKLVAILAADIEGYSRSMHADEETALAVLTAHRTICDKLIESNNGRVSGSAGDSIVAEFGSVTDALNCAVAIQQSIHQANKSLPAASQMSFRIGINVGDVMVREGDLYGDGVNVAARVEGLAEPGGIYATRAVRDQVRDRAEFDFEDLGEKDLKNISRPVRIFRVVFNSQGNLPWIPLSTRMNWKCLPTNCWTQCQYVLSSRSGIRSRTAMIQQCLKHI